MSTTLVSISGSVTHLPFVHVFIYCHDVSMTRHHHVDTIIQWKRISTMYGYKSKLEILFLYVTGSEAEVEAS